MKTSDAYTDAIGEDMGIKSASQDLDQEAANPKFSGEAFPGYVRLKFTKNGPRRSQHLFTPEKDILPAAFFQGIPIPLRRP
jgi:hypothetical protein